MDRNFGGKLLELENLSHKIQYTYVCVYGS